MDDKKVNIPVEDPSKPDAPKKEHNFFQQAKEKFAPHSAHPGPAMPKNLDAPEEGTAEERKAKAAELNK